MKWDTAQPTPTVKDFDNKVSEADAYLQLMIEQTKVSTIHEYIADITRLMLFKH